MNMGTKEEWEESVYYVAYLLWSQIVYGSW